MPSSFGRCTPPSSLMTLFPTAPPPPAALPPHASLATSPSFRPAIPTATGDSSALSARSPGAHIPPSLSVPPQLQLAPHSARSFPPFQLLGTIPPSWRTATPPAPQESRRRNSRQGRRSTNYVACRTCTLPPPSPTSCIKFHASVPKKKQAEVASEEWNGTSSGPRSATYELPRRSNASRIAFTLQNAKPCPSLRPTTGS